MIIDGSQGSLYINKLDGKQLSLTLRPDTLVIFKAKVKLGAKITLGKDMRHAVIFMQYAIHSINM